MVSEKIIKNKPIIKVKYLTLEYLEFSLEVVIKIKGINIKIGIYKGIIKRL